jgi:hypothetical protein
MDKVLADGLYFNEPYPNTPNYIKGSLAIHKERFMVWLENQPTNEKGYLKLDHFEGKEGKHDYFLLNTYQKPQNGDQVKDSQR